MQLVETISFRRGKLPHWEIKNGRYFVTVRLADSLPSMVVAQLQEIHRALSVIESASAQFSALQREYFYTMEKYMDAGAGACLLRDPAHAGIIRTELLALEEWNVAVPHFTIMPNHWHALIAPSADSNRSLGEIMKRIKGRTGRQIRVIAGGGGAVWQREWFDRWIRDDHEWDKTVAYIRNNPVKAGLVTAWAEHAWTQ